MNAPPPVGGPTESQSRLHCQRSLFSLPRDVHWLNCAYLSPLSRSVEEAGIRAIRRKSAPTEIGPEDFFRDSHTLRQLFAELIGAADGERVAILPAASYGLAACAQNLEVGADHNLVTVHEQFPGNVYTWRSLAQRTGAELRTVMPPEGAVRGPQWTERVLEAIDKKTALVTIGHVHWTDGTLFDLDRISRRAREVGAAFIVDGTQSVGALPLDVGQIQPDAVIVAGYKWLMGPYSIGLGWFGPRFDGGRPLEETWIARKGSENFAGLVDYVDEYQPGAIRYDVGERSNFILVPMLVEALRMVLEWRPENVQQYCRRLTGELVREARELGFTIEDDDWRGAHMFGIRVPAAVDAGALQARFLDRGVHVSRRGEAFRISPHVYNDSQDTAAFIEALKG